MGPNLAWETIMPPPYQDLFIYYLEGHLSTEAGLKSNIFIGNWEEDNFSFLFFSQPAVDILKDLLATQPQLTLLDQFQMTYEEWQGGPIKPFKMGRFTIVPPWCHSHNAFNSDKIVLDPGVVFGAGTHPTTRDCMAALELAFSINPSAVTLDIGTGTGLLAIAAARLGSLQVIAVDLNHLATRTALSNVRYNGLCDQIIVLCADAQKSIDLPSDLMISNIHYDVMKNLIHSKGFLNNRQFILSGLLRSQAKIIIDQLTQYPIKIIQRWSQEGIWHTFYGEVIQRINVYED
jgi:ribosomal protein L11 methyltransferase